MLSGAAKPCREQQKVMNPFDILFYFLILSVATKNDGKMRKNGQEQRGKDDGAPSRSLAGS